jgi:deoxyribodipyrimidine photo-lyase
MDKPTISLFWFRRDLRLDDNTALFHALASDHPVLPIFIFDDKILDKLDRQDSRVQFIYQNLEKIHAQLRLKGGSLLLQKGDPLQIFQEIIEHYNIDALYYNEDYEPYALERDWAVGELFSQHAIPTKAYKDHVIFAKNEVLKKDGTPYRVFTAYKNKWLQQSESISMKPLQMPTDGQFFQNNCPLPSHQAISFEPTTIQARPFSLDILPTYEQKRDTPNQSTSDLGPHLRFGTVSCRQIIDQLDHQDHIFMSELIWREFFFQLLYHFPSSAEQNFKPAYDEIKWRNNREEFDKWCKGQTGYPMVDAGMRELNETGYMHNRVRMVVAGFLCKHLLIDWRWGAAYFAEKLMDFELSSNTGNWQWAAGTGCDASPYFRVFNPSSQLKKFDKQMTYVKKWIPELLTDAYPNPVVEHKYARLRAIETYKTGLKKITTKKS